MSRENYIHSNKNISYIYIFEKSEKNMKTQKNRKKKFRIEIPERNAKRVFLLKKIIFSGDSKAITFGFKKNVIITRELY